MDTWNTITHLSRTRLRRAQFVLETLCSDEMIPVLDLLRQWGKMSLAELSLATGETSVILEEQLGLLCDTGCVVQEKATFGNSYWLSPQRIRQINGISRRINQISAEAQSD